MIVVDSSVFIDLYRKTDHIGTQKLKQASKSEDLIVLDVVLLEVLQGARDDLHSHLLERELRTLRLERAISFNLATVGALYSRKLRGLGITLRKTVDLIIGTWCIENDCRLLHNDRDFLPMVRHLGLKEF